MHLSDRPLLAGGACTLHDCVSCPCLTALVHNTLPSNMWVLLQALHLLLVDG
jgi:hypothetical protein